MPGPVIVHVCKMKGIGGCEKQLLELLPALRQQGLDIRLIVLEDKAQPVPGLAADFQSRGVPTERMPIFRDVDVALVFRLARRLRALEADVAHTHLIHADVHGTLAARLAGVPRVISTRHSAHRFYEKRFIRFLDSMIARLADRGVSISEYARRYYASLGIFPPAKSACVYYGMAPFGGDPASARALRREAGAGETTVVVSLVSRLIPGKGHDVFLKAAEALPSAGSHQFWIVGDGPLRPALEQSAAGLAARVRLWGFRSDIPNLLAASDIVCVPTSPSLREGLNLVLLEAGAAGRPCVASRMGPFPEIVEDEKTGLLFVPDDVQSLTAALRRLSQDPALRRRMGDCARRRVAENFSMARAVEGYRATYRALADGPALEPGEARSTALAGPLRGASGTAASQSDDTSASPFRSAPRTAASQSDDTSARERA